MGLTANVVPNAPILSSWGNTIRDRTIQYFASAAERTAQWVSPPDGAFSWLDDVAELQVYNASTWISLTAKTAEVLTAQTTTSTAYADLATAGPQVTILCGGKALVTVSAEGSLNTAPDISFAAVAVSGATTRAAADDYGTVIGHPVANVTIGGHSTFEMAGLTPGSNTFKLRYRTTGGSTATFLRRRISVVGVP